MKLAKRSFGFTMTDAVWLMMIVTVVLIPIAGVFPMGHLGVGKAKNIEVGLYLANEWVNRLRQQFPSQLVNNDVTPFQVSSMDTVNGQVYQVTEELYTVETRQWEFNTVLTQECDILDVKITVDFPPGDSLASGNRTATAPFIFTTRLYKDMKQFGAK